MGTQWRFLTEGSILVLRCGNQLPEINRKGINNGIHE